MPAATRSDGVSSSVAAGSEAVNSVTIDNVATNGVATSGVVLSGFDVCSVTVNRVSVGGVAVNCVVIRGTTSLIEVRKSPDQELGLVLQAWHTNTHTVKQTASYTRHTANR